MNNRLSLQSMLEGILGTRNVYYQPPESLNINYPAIIYSRADIPNKFANNDVYKQNFKYRVVFIDSNPDSTILNKLLTIKTARFERHYIVNNLNHDSFTIYY